MSRSEAGVRTGAKPALVGVLVHTGTKPASEVVLLETGAKPAFFTRASEALGTTDAKLVSVVGRRAETNRTDFFFLSSVGQFLVACHRLPHVSHPEEP